jgi:hypothetical protein
MTLNTNRTNHYITKKAEEDMAIVTNRGTSQIQTASKL